MPQADGTVLIDTEINADGMEAGTKEVEAAARRMASSVENIGTKAKTALNKQVDAFVKLNQEYAAQSQKVDELRQKVEAYGNQKIPTDEYAEIQNQISQAEQQMTKLINAQERFAATGGSENSSAYKRRQYDIEELANTIKYAEAELKDLEASGKAFTDGMSTKEAVADMQKLEAAERRLSDLNNRLGTSYSAIKNQVNDYNESIVKTTSDQNKFNKSLNDTDKSAKKGNLSMGRMLATSILFSFVFQAISAVTTGVREGFENLAQYSESTNRSLSMLMSSLTRLKNSFATAFSPILNVVAPILSQFIDMISAAATAVGQLMAALTGQNTFTRAIAVQEDYAQSLQETGKAASDAGKDAKKALAPFDDLVQIQLQNEESSSGGSTNVDPSNMFEEIAVSNSLEGLKRIWNEVKELFLTGFLVGFGDLSRLDDIRMSLISIRESLIDIFADPAVVASANNFFKIFLYSLGVIAGSIASIGVTIASNLIGGMAQYLESAKDIIKSYIVDMFDISSEISLIISGFVEAFANVFSALSGENGKNMTENLIGIFSGLFMGLTEIAFKAGRDILDVLLTPLSNNQEGFKKMFDGILEAASTIFGALRSLVEDTFSKINEVYDAHIEPMVDAFVDGLTQIWNTATSAFNEYIIPVLQQAADKFAEFRELYLQPLIDKFLEFAGNVIDIITMLWSSVLAPFISWFIANVAPVISLALNVIIEVFFLLLEIVTSVISGVMDVLNGIITFLKGNFASKWGKAWERAKEKASEVWNGIVGIITGCVNSILSAIENVVNGVIKAINWLIRQINKISIDVPATPFTDAVTIGFNIPELDNIKLPRLASGTVIPPNVGEFAAILGDNKRETEIVSPVSAIKEALLEALQESGSVGEQNITIRFEGSMSSLARALKPELDRETARRGTNLVIVGGR